MSFKLLSTFLGVHNLPLQAQKLIHKYVILGIFLNFAFFLSTTFFVLYVIDSVGIVELGILLAIRYFVQAILDYPSGVLGDWIGHKWVLFTAYLTFAFSYIALVFANSFYSFLVVYILFAIGASQQSGALTAWFENNYKIAIGDMDPERKTYMFFLGKHRVISLFTATVPFIIGGIVSTLYTRELVFIIQAISMFFLAVTLLLLINNLTEVEKHEKRSFSSYIKLMWEGISFVISNKVMFFLVVAICLNAVCTIIWIEMILYPLYYGYTGSDGWISVLRVATIAVGIPTAAVAANVSSKAKLKWLPVVVLVSNILFYGGFMLLTMGISIDQNLFNLTAILLVILIYAFSFFFIQIGQIFEQRIFLDFIPDRNRNSIYSLIPTIVLMINIPSVGFGGALIEEVGVSMTLFFLILIGLLAPVFYWITVHFLSVDSLDHKN